MEPATPESSGSVLFISDHFGDLPQLAVDDGDLTLTGSDSEYHLVDAFFNKLEQLGIPILFTVGNHDLGSASAQQRSRIGIENEYTVAVASLTALFNKYVVGKPYVLFTHVGQFDSIVRFGMDIFVLLRSQHRKKERIKGEQIEWAITALHSVVNVDGCRLHLIAHHSLWQDEGGDKHTPLDRRRRLEDDLLSQFSVSAFVHGHNHRFTFQNTTTPKRGLRLYRIGVPTMCTRNRNFERGFLEWNPSTPNVEPLLIKLHWHQLQDVDEARVNLDSSSPERS